MQEPKPTTAELFFSDPELINQLKTFGVIRKYHAGQFIIQPGEPITHVPIVLEGSVRIIRENEEGEEVFLYHLFPGQTCAMSLSCCRSGMRSMVMALAETDTRLIMLPTKQMEDWFRFEEWKAYVNNNYQARFTELLQVIDLIAFNHMDKQLLHYLKERTKAQGTEVLSLTHQEIAEELNTQREAISRLLRNMEKKGLVELGRNSIKVNAGIEEK